MTQDTGGESGYDAADLNVQLTGERSQNGARALEGYPLDVRPDGSWPGLDTASGQVRVRPEELKRVSQWLATQAGYTESLPQWLSSATAVSFGPASWHEATNLKDASEMLTRAVAEHISKVVLNLGQANASITAAHAAYDTTEQSNTDTMTNVDGGL
jgi:hypothetical protein